MNRLTVRYSGIHVGYQNKYNNSVLCSEMTVPQIRECMEKLATYEDTGLEPEQIDELNKMLLNDQIRHGRALDKLLEYQKLEKQGLLIKLPCKVGDVVYLLGGKDYNKFRVGCVDWKSGMEYKGKNYQLYMEDNYYDEAYRNFSDIGKTVFLTREEAEKALEERK